MSESVFENSSRFVAADVRRLKFPWYTTLLMEGVSLLTSAAAIFQTRSETPNNAHSVDAPITFLFHIVRPSRRATDAQHWL